MDGNSVSRRDFAQCSRAKMGVDWPSMVQHSTDQWQWLMHRLDRSGISGRTVVLGLHESDMALTN
jgi:hypothetical protein